jgi:stage V sporulation protein S
VISPDPEARSSQLRVGSSTSPQSAASSIFRCVTESHVFPEVRAIGHGAIGQAVKALAISRGLLAPKAIDLAVIPGFETIVDDQGKEISAMVFRTFAR